MKAEELLEKDLRAGLYLCTQGTCSLTVNDRSCYITYGQVLIKTPLVRLGNIESSDDFEFTTIRSEENRLGKNGILIKVRIKDYGRI